MATRQLTSAFDLERFGAWVTAHKHGSLWQSLSWKAYQEARGREVRIFVEEENNEIKASALVVIDRTTGGLTTWEIPRGPLAIADWELGIGNFLPAIVEQAKSAGALSIFLSPPQSIRQSANPPIRISSRHVHPTATRVIDLTQPEEAILAQMKPKGRYNIGLAEKHSVMVRKTDDIEAFAQLMDETAKRDGFRPSGAKTYRAFLQNLPGSFLLLAYAPDTSDQGQGAPRPIAGLLGAIWGSQGIYYYGVSSSAHRELMAPYLLQWEAMRHCKAAGCNTYDLFGIAPEGAVNHPWAGVSEFKAKFGGTVVTYPPEQEIVLRPWAKKTLQLKRKILG